MELAYYLVVGVAGLAVRLWLGRAMAPVIPQTSYFARPPRPLVVDLDAELETIASALDLVLEPTGSPDERRASNGSIAIDYRVGRGLASRVQIARRGAPLPVFVLLPHPDASADLPASARLRVTKLLREERAAAPFVGWAPPPGESWASFRRAAVRAAHEVELLEHADGVMTAWIVSWSPAHLVEQVHRLQRFRTSSSPRRWGPTAERAGAANDASSRSSSPSSSSAAGRSAPRASAGASCDAGSRRGAR